MVFCWKCGTEQGENAAYCHKCGAMLRASAPVEGKAGFEVLRDDKTAQNHWLARVIAYIIDAVMVFVIVIILAIPFLVAGSLAPGFPFVGPFWGLWGLWLGGIPLVIVAYFVLAEWRFERTIGKQAMGLRVARIDGKPMDFWAALIRNLSKLNPLLLLLDLFGGLVTRGEASQKFSDRLVGTKVETVSRLNIIS